MDFTFATHVTHFFNSCTLGFAAIKDELFDALKVRSLKRLYFRVFVRMRL
jgi:hypothetical protein